MAVTTSQVAPASEDVRTAKRRPVGRQAAHRSAPSKVAQAAAGLVLLLVSGHVGATVVYDLPHSSERVPGVYAAVREYMEPLFLQDYRIFAPNPASDDREMYVRAWIETANGTETTAWVNVTRAELSDTRRVFMRKQLSIVGVERLASAFRGLSEEQKEIARTNYHRAGDVRLRTDLLEADAPDSPAAVTAFMRSSDYVVGYATQVAHALWGDDGELRGVQVRAVYTSVPRWARRHDDDAPTPSTMINLGWRAPVEYRGQDREAFAETFRGWQE